MAGSAVARLCARVSESSAGAEASDSHAASEPSWLGLGVGSGLGLGLGLGSGSANSNPNPNPNPRLQGRVRSVRVHAADDGGRAYTLGPPREAPQPFRVPSQDLLDRPPGRALQALVGQRQPNDHDAGRVRGERSV